MECECGVGRGINYNRNVVMPHGCTDDEFRQKYDVVVRNVMSTFEAEVIVLVAGADGLAG